MSQYKLTYFNGKGRAEPVRLLLAHAKVDYQDDRIEGSQWGTIKATTPFGQLPVFTDGDFTLSQSLVILKYVGVKHGYSGSNDQESARIDEYLAAVSDLLTVFFTLKMEQDPERKAKLENTAKNEKAPFYLKKFEAAVLENGGYLVGGKPTYADFLLFSFIEYLISETPAALDSYPALRKHFEAIRNAAGVTEYLAKRPVTPW